MRPIQHHFLRSFFPVLLFFQVQNLLAQNPCLGPNLWQNGSFENISNPLDAGWNPNCYPTTNNYPTIVELNPNGYYPPITNPTPQGNQFLWFDNTVTPCAGTAPGTNLPILTQTIPTIVGESYVFSFWLYQHCVQIAGEVGLSVNGQILTTQTTDASQIPNCTPGWQQISVNFVATSSTTALQLVDIGWQSWGHDYAFDNMSIQKTSLAVTPPDPQSICEGECATLSIGGNGTQFLWNTGATVPTITVCPPKTTYYSAIVSNNDKCVDSIEVLVEVLPKPLANAGADQVICDSFCTTLNATGGLWYSWSNGWDTSLQTVCPDSSQTYAVTVTNDFKCQSVDSVKVTVIPPPQITVLSVECLPNSNFYQVFFQIQNGGQISVNAGFVIDSGSTAIVFNIPEGTPLWINVFNGVCENIFSVASPDCSCPPLAPPQITGGATLCEGDPLPKLTVTNASGTMLVEWFDAAVGGNFLGAGTDFFPKTGGKFFAQFLDSLTDCPSQRTLVEVKINPKPKPVLQPLAQICKGECATITASGGDLYLWSNGATGATAQFCPPATDSFSLKIFTSAGCSASANLKIEVADFPKITLLDTLCSSDSQTWSAVVAVAPAQQVFFSTGNWQSSGANFSVSQLAAGDSLLVSAVNGAQGCLAELKIPPMQFPVADAGLQKTILCDQNSTFLEGTAGSGNPLELVWATADGSILAGAKTLAPTVASAGWYFLEVKNQANGCLARDSVLVKKNLPPALELAIEQPRCFGDFGKILIENTSGGLPPYLFSLDTAAFSSKIDFENLPSGKFEIRVRDSVGCESEATATLAEPPQRSLALDSLEVLKFGEQVELRPQLFNFSPASIGSVAWSPAQFLSCSDCLEPTTRVFENTVFTLTLLDTAGCPAVARVAVEVGEVAVFVPNVFAPGLPENENAVFTLFSSPDAIEKIEWLRIYDRWGELVFENRGFAAGDFSAGWDGRFRGRDALVGVYVWLAAVRLADGSELRWSGDLTLVR